MTSLNYRFSYDASEVNKCLLCYEPACTAACPEQVPVGDILRSLYMENWMGAAGRGCHHCLECDAPCEKACVLSARNVPVRIREILTQFHNDAERILPKHLIEEVDLSCDICGVKL
jgi:dihydropyrimidine dehydrogenase (NAD+) subunit PreA